MLNQKEEQQLVKLLKKVEPMRNYGLPKAVFDELCRLVVFPSCELVIINKQKGVLLTYRHDEFWRGWHVPGRLFRFGQSFQQVLGQTARIELGCRLASSKFLFPLDYGRGKRGQAVGLVFLGQLSGQPKDGKFFKTMPKNIIADHKELWRGLKRLNLIK